MNTTPPTWGAVGIVGISAVHALTEGLCTPGAGLDPRRVAKCADTQPLSSKSLQSPGRQCRTARWKRARKEKNADRHTCLYICRQLGGRFFPDFFPLPIPEKRAGKVIVNTQSPRPLAGEPLNFPLTPAPPQQPAQVWPGTSVVLSPDSPAFGEGEGRPWSACNPNLCPLQSLLPSSPVPSPGSDRGQQPQSQAPWGGLYLDVKSNDTSLQSSLLPA